MKKYKNYWLKKKRIAHRGLHDQGANPENTLAACEKALESGFAIELDVRVLRDGTVIVFHDKTLDRMTDGHGKVRSRDYVELRRYEVRKTTEFIPLLQDVFDLVDGRVPIFVELKTGFFSAQKDVRHVSSALGKYEGQCAFLSFDPGTVRFWQKNHSGNPVGQLFHGENFLQLWLSIFSWIIYGRHGDFLAVPVSRVDLWFFDWMRNKKRPLITWTVKDSAQKDLARKHADNYIFDQSNDFSG